MPQTPSIRRTFRLALWATYILCVILFLTFATLWIRSYFVADAINRDWSVAWPETTTLAGNPPTPALHIHRGQWSLFAQSGYLCLYAGDTDTLHILPIATAAGPFQLKWNYDHTPARPMPESAHRFYSSWFRSADWKSTDPFDSFPRPPTTWEKGHTGLYALPLWLLTLPFLLLASLPLLHFLPSRRRARRSAQGVCPTCAYDLRAHAPGSKCPECGTPILVHR